MLKEIAPQLSNDAQRSCHVKLRYRTMKACCNAIKQLKKMRSVKINGFHNDAYHCKFCDGWHLGNRPVQNDTNTTVTTL